MKLVMQDIAEEVLPDQLVNPSPDDFEEEIYRAHRKISAAVASAAEGKRARLEREYRQFARSSHGDSTNEDCAGKIGDTPLVEAIFSVYVTRLLQEFAHTIAYDPPMRSAVGGAIRSLGLDPDTVRQTASLIERQASA